MRIRSVATLLCFAMASAPALAMDCSKASSKLERRICADTKLKSADDTMSAVYFKLLRSIQDTDIRAALIHSQQRWLKVRERDLGDMVEDHEDYQLSPADQRAILLKATRERTRYLKQRHEDQPAFVTTARKQKAAIDGYTGGPFAGYEVSCSFIPSRGEPTNYGYDCYGSHAYQEGDRVCGQRIDFASYHIHMTRGVADVEHGQLKPVAWCKDTDCPTESSGDDAHWNTEPTMEQLHEVFGTRRPTLLDPELYEDEDQAWIHTCLTQPTFP